MELRLDLVKKLLLIVEQTPANRVVPVIQIEGVDQDTVDEHLELLIKDAHYLEGKVHPGGSGQQRIVRVHVDRMTKAGHEFLANAKNETVWNKTVATVKEKGSSFSLELISRLLNQIAAQQLGLGA